MGGSFRLTTRKNTFVYPEEESRHLQSSFSSIIHKAGIGYVLKNVPITECDIVTFQFSGFHNGFYREIAMPSLFF